MKDYRYRINESIEHMQNFGPNGITNEELLAIILGNREKACKMLHQDDTLFSASQNGLKCLAGQDFDGLKFLGDLTKAEASKILAAIEIGKRIAYASETEREHITSPGDAAQYLMGRMRNLTHEYFVVLLLNTKNRIIRVKQIAEGSLTSAVVHPREVFAPAVMTHAACILVAHNHPSADPYPSAEDRHLTQALEEAGNVMGIPLLDHLVVGDGRYYSFKEHGDL